MAARAGEGVGGVCRWGKLTVDKDKSPMMRDGESAGDFMKHLNDGDGVDRKKGSFGRCV